MFLFKKTTFLCVKLNQNLDDFISMSVFDMEMKLRSAFEDKTVSSDDDSCYGLGFILPFNVCTSFEGAIDFAVLLDKPVAHTVTIPSSDGSSMDFVLCHCGDLASSTVVDFLSKFVTFIGVLSKFSQHYPEAGRLLSYIFNR